LGVAFNAVAQTPIAKCPNGYESTAVNISATVSTREEGCPLLKDKELRKLVDKYLTGSVFAYPDIPGTCLSGEISEGSITIGGQTLAVSGSTESAQRFFPEAAAVDPGNRGLLIFDFTVDNRPFVLGAAATIVTLQGADSEFNLRLVLDDRFGVTLTPTFEVVDTEEFTVIGAEGASVRGRLMGTATLGGFPPPIQNAAFTVAGDLCMK